MTFWPIYLRRLPAVVLLATAIAFLGTLALRAVGVGGEWLYLLGGLLTIGCLYQAFFALTPRRRPFARERQMSFASPRRANSRESFSEVLGEVYAMQEMTMRHTRSMPYSGSEIRVLSLVLVVVMVIGASFSVLALAQGAGWGSVIWLSPALLAAGSLSRLLFAPSFEYSRARTFLLRGLFVFVLAGVVAALAQSLTWITLAWSALAIGSMSAIGPVVFRRRDKPPPASSHRRTREKDSDEG